MALFDNNDIQINNEKNELLDSLYAKDLYIEIIKSKSFERLKDIHFLGAIDYLYTNKKKHTRFEHTLSVATLALKYSRIKKLKMKDEKYLICAALLHDIGHGPLSHSMEPSFKKLFGITHHSAGINIIIGSSPLGKEIYGILKKHKVDINKLIKLLDGKSKESYAFALYNPINIDTIDGILRTYTYLANSRNKNKNLTLLPNMYKILEAITDINQLNILDDFWKLKDFVYSKIINNDLHIYADNISQKYVLNQYRICENDFYLSEQQFKESYRKLFDNLKTLKKQKEEIFNAQLNYTKRSYRINSSIHINNTSEYFEKYIHTKVTDVLKTNNVKKYTYQTFNL
jgi:putative nucleotidyltransferase with HDIG domain